ncbi:hypothetical protein EJ04DRAFT_507635 [Polyplosphaeria fusca]|uniref:Uncharacterized protein n=1 Tax=Polyplosphaeria fusca TaxID=682080 RepID=A0A9P4R7C7_9PLEO|nr:hypothetical protein EJ04DRAFT_507635 [Polyplosphaeria fusca]
MEKMATDSQERNLRIVLIVSFIPALALSIASGIHGRTATAFIAIAPLVLSVLSGAVHLVLIRRQKVSLRQKIGEGPTLLLDLLLGGFYLGVLIPFWIIESKSRSYWGVDIGGIMLDTYASVFHIANMVIHWWLFLVNFKVSRECPSCGERSGLVPNGRITLGGSATKTVDRGAAYSLLGEHGYAEEEDSDPKAKETRISEETSTVEEV